MTTARERLTALFIREADATLAMWRTHRYVKTPFRVFAARRRAEIKAVRMAQLMRCNVAIVSGDDVIFRKGDYVFVMPPRVPFALAGDHVSVWGVSRSKHVRHAGEGESCIFRDGPARKGAWTMDMLTPVRERSKAGA